MSAFEAWLNAGNTGTLSQFLASIRGDDGDDGDSAYDLAVDAGYSGTQSQWLASLNGQSAYQAAVAGGFVGTQSQWLASLVGQDGKNAFTLTTAAFTMPGFDGTNTISVQYADWMGLGQPVFLEGAGTLRVSSFPSGGSVLLMNANVNWQLNVLAPATGGVPGNAAPGTVIPIGAKLSPGGRPAKPATQGLPGPVGIPGDIPVVDALLLTVPPPNERTQILRDTATTPATFTLYRHDGTNWTNQGVLSGAPGARMLFGTTDPNSQPATYGRNGDIHIQNNQRIWERIGPGSWADRGVFTSNPGGGALDAQVFRVGKTFNQPIPTGSTAATIVQFELLSGSGFYNGGWWNGSEYNAQAGIQAVMSFLVEGLRIFRTAGGGENITWAVSINIKNTPTVTTNMVVVTPATESLLPVLTTGPQAVDASIWVNVTITPSVAPTNQWYVDTSGIVFYNQT